jgi:hypothetical protein
MAKIKKEELTKLQDLVKNYNQHQLKLGELEVEKHGLLHSISNVQQDLQKFQDELRETYGDVSIDINDGKIAENESSKED